MDRWDLIIIMIARVILAFRYNPWRALSVFFDLRLDFVYPFMSSWFSFILSIFSCYISFPFVMATYSIVRVMSSGYLRSFSILILSGLTSFATFSFVLFAAFQQVMLYLSFPCPHSKYGELLMLKRYRWWLRPQ